MSRAGTPTRALVSGAVLATISGLHGPARPFDPDILRMSQLPSTTTRDFPGEERLALMQETGSLLAPHGAGLTNVMFCPPATDLVAIADPGFPNPNFYALDCALRHRYWILPARSSGTGHPLEKDPEAAAEAVRGVLRRLGEES
jgi:hypothetical protein